MDKSLKFTAIICASIIAIAISFLVIMLPMKQVYQASHSEYTGVKREFWLFNSGIPDFNETKMQMPHDVYSIPTISVYKGDTIVIHFLNKEEIGGDKHSFTITEPYNIDVVVNPSENKTITFDAHTAGIFAFYCKFHQPTMRGQLIVQQDP